MIRELGVHSTKYTPANMTAAVAMVTGMGAQISVADGNVILPAAEAASDIYFVEKERTVDGIYSALTDFDDYFEVSCMALTSLLTLWLMETRASACQLVLTASGLLLRLQVPLFLRVL